MRKALRSRLTGQGFKPPQAAMVKNLVMSVEEKAWQKSVSGRD